MGTTCGEGAGRHEGTAAIWEFLRAQLPSPLTGPAPSSVTLGAQNRPHPHPIPAGGGELTSRPAPAQRLPLPRHSESRPLGTGCAAPIDGEGPSWCVISLLQERT